MWEYSDEDFKYFIQSLNPRLAKMLLNNQYIQKMLTIFRKYSPTAILLFLLIHFVVVFPLGVFKHWDDKVSIIDSSIGFVIYMSMFIVIFGDYFQREQFHILTDQLENYVKELEMDNDEQRAWFQKAQKFCKIISNAIYLVFAPAMMISLSVFVFVGCLPARTMFLSGWYPYDVTASPAYELTLFISLTSFLLGLLLANSLACTLISVFVYLISLFEILVNKFTCFDQNSEGTMEELNMYGGPVKDNNQTFFHYQDKLFGEVVEVNEDKLFGEIVKDNPLNKCNLPRVEECAQGTNKNTHRLQHRGVWYNKRATRKLGLRYSTQRKSLNKISANKISDTCLQISSDKLDDWKRIQLLSLIQLHQKLMSITEQFIEYYIPFFYVLFGLNVVAYGGTILILTMSEDWGTKEIFVISIGVEVVVLFLVLCAMSSIINIQSSRVSEAVYASDWIRSSRKYKWLIMMVMIRATRPVCLKAPGTGNLSLERFTQVTNMAYRTTATLTSFVEH